MLRALAILVLLAVPAASFAASDQDVRDLIIKESIQAYPGNCPCPYNTMRNGRACGGRSAYSRPGGRAPLCYPKDVPDQMVKAYRAQPNIR